MSGLELPPSLVPSRPAGHPDRAAQQADHPDRAAQQAGHPDSGPDRRGAGPPGEGEGSLIERAAGAFTRWAERWVPDAAVFALAATVLVLIAAVAVGGRGPLEVLGFWGDGLWELLPFTLQMALVIITGHVLAMTGPVHRVIAWLASWPRTPRAAVALVAFLAMAASWFNWGFGLIFAAMLAREVARRVGGVDYRAVAAASFLGLGSVWAQGLSGSAALQMATAQAMPAPVRAIVEGKGMIAGGIIPLKSTIFLWQSLLSVAIEMAIVTAVMALATPPASRARTAADLGIDLGPSPADRAPPERRGTPGDWLEHSPLLSVCFALLAFVHLGRSFLVGGKGLAALSLNAINLGFLALGFLLHRTPARLLRAFREATPGVWGVLLQFPFYAGIAAVITRTDLSERVARAFVSVSTPATFPAVIAVYSAALGVFVPSGGSKWVIEAPYVLQAAHDLHVHLGWMVAVYDLGEALANLIQPFWMLPILGLFGLRARDVMGYTGLVFVILAPVVLVLVTVLGATLTYPL